MIRIPELRISPCGDSWTASAAYRLVSLRTRASPATVNCVAPRHATAELIKASLNWPFSVRLELLWNFTPAASLRAAVAAVWLLVETRGSSRNEATESGLTHSLAFQPLLDSCWPQADFRAHAPEPPPFDVCGRLRIGRFHQALEPARRATTAPGFLPSGNGTPSPAPAFTWPWASSDERWNALYLFLAHYLAPQAISIRVRRDLVSNPLPALPALSLLPPEAAPFYGAMLRHRAELAHGGVRLDASVLSPFAPVDPAVAEMAAMAIAGPPDPDNLQGGFEFRDDDDPFSLGEAAAVFRLPTPLPDAVPMFPVPSHLTLDLPRRYMDASDGPQFGYNLHRGDRTAIRLPSETRLLPTLLIGATGSGKSTQLLSLALDHIQAGDGVCFIDPHGDAVEQILATVPDNREDDVILLDLADPDAILPFNVLACSSARERDFILDELLASLLRVYRDPAMFGPVFERNFRGMLQLLTSAPGWTMLELPLVFSDAQFRRSLLSRVDDPVLEDFVREAERANSSDYRLENIAPYIISKLSRFFHDGVLRRMVGHGDMAIPFREVLDSGKMVLVKLARGRVGAAIANVLAMQIVNRIYSAAMQRASVPLESRRPFYLMIDEFGSVADESFLAILSESRKYGLSVTLAIQYLAQLRDRGATRDILPAVLGNAGVVAAFRLGPQDAGLLAPWFQPLGEADLMSVPNLSGYARALVSGAGQSISFTCEPVRVERNPAKAERLRFHSTNRWCVPAEDCDRRIRERRLRTKTSER